MRISDFRTWLVFGAICLIGWSAYWPGLGGDFLFDDFVNLDALGRSGPVDDWPGFWRYLTSGTADPLGRPIALLSFLVNANNWPADPRPFLTTNLILHLCNAGLLFTLLRKLDVAVRPSRPGSEAAALLASGLWLLHPLFVSTTLYAVQREAMLPVTFILLGLVAYSAGRMRFAESNGDLGMPLMVSGIVFGTLLAMLSKANGILLPLLAWALEASVFQAAGLLPLSERSTARLHRMKLLILIIPSSVLFMYVGSFLLEWNTIPGDRGWTIGQRVLTEPRVLLDYLTLLAVPRSISTGLYNDGYAASLSLLHPASTVFSLLAIGALVFLAFHTRRSYPRLSAALLFFFAGHLLESTSVPLELYFEHRNYLPALLLFWPLAHGISVLKVAQPLRVAAGLALVAIFAATTYQRAALWGNPPRLTALWASQNPESSRALATAAIDLVNLQRPEAATALLAPHWQRKPTDFQLGAVYVSAACREAGLTANTKQAIQHTLSQTRQGKELTYRWLASTIVLARAGTCVGLTIADAESMVSAAASNPYLAPANGQSQEIEQLLGRLKLAKGNPSAALRYFNRALLAQVKPEVALKQAAMLASDRQYTEALAHLDYFEKVRSRAALPRSGMPWLHSKVLEWQDYWGQEFGWMRARLRAEAAKREATDLTQN